MLLDRIADDWRGLCNLIQAAFTHKKYNLACSLLRILKRRMPSTAALKQYDLLFHFAENCTEQTDRIIQVVSNMC